MTGAVPDPIADLISTGLTLDSVNPELRDLVFGDEPDLARLLDRLRVSSLDDVVALSTCERIEIFAVSRSPEADGVMLEILAGETGADVTALQGQMCRRHGNLALDHLFAVAAGLESQVVGEPQILGQVKESHRQATALGLVGPGLEPMLQAAYQTAKRVRNETDIGHYTVSIAASALMVARDVHGDLGRCSALVIGLGEMAEFIAGEIKAAGVGDIVVLHPTLARARAVAHRLNGHFRPWEELDQALAAADIVVGALGTGQFSVTRRQGEQALQARRRAPMYFIDAAVPRDIEPAVNDLDGAFVYDLEDLERIAMRGRASREGAIQAARDIVAQELAVFSRQHAARGAAPAVVALRQHFEAVRAEVLAAGGLDADEATRRLINRLLHDPTVVLRTAAAEDAEQGTVSPFNLEATLKRLFHLDGGKSRTSPGPARGRGPAKEKDK